MHISLTQATAVTLVKAGIVGESEAAMRGQWPLTQDRLKRG